MINPSLVRRVPLFETLPDSELESLVSGLRPVRYSAQTLLFHEGAVGDRFYIILEGRIAIIKAAGTADELHVALRGPGEFVGEMSLLNQNGLRTASAQAHDDVLLLELTRADFDTLLMRNPLLAYQMLRILSTRLRQSHELTIASLQEKNRLLTEAYFELQAAQEQLAEKRALEREMQRAREIQQSMLPRIIPRLPGFDIGARMVPARMVGGDLFDLIPLSSNRLAIAIGDVSGKSVPAALFMALTSSLIRAEAHRADDPEHVLLNVNHNLRQMNDKGMFVTALYGILNGRSGTFHYARAGHDQPLIGASDGSWRALPLALGQPLGLFARPFLDTQTIALRRGDRMLLFTDGVTEAENAQGEMFDLSGLQAAAAGSRTGSAQALCDTLIERLRHYHGDAPQTDDITIITVDAHANPQPA